MADGACERGGSPRVGLDPIEDAAQAYLEGSDGNPSAALRAAVADVVTLNHLAVLMGEGVSWGFLRKPKAAMFAGGDAR